MFIRPHVNQSQIDNNIVAGLKDCAGYRRTLFLSSHGAMIFAAFSVALSARYCLPSPWSHAVALITLTLLIIAMSVIAADQQRWKEQTLSTFNALERRLGLPETKGHREREEVPE